MLAPASATRAVQIALLSWGAIELALRLRAGPGRHRFDWSLLVLVASMAAAFTIGFRVSEARSTLIGGGWAPVAVGLAVLCLGVGLRVWAILTLGRFFRFVVVIQEGHRVVRTGPYRRLRHPAYTGTLIAFAGAGIGLANWLSVLVLTVLPLAGLLVRIRAEEAALTAALGDEYREYAAHTRRLIPGVW